VQILDNPVIAETAGAMRLARLRKYGASVALLAVMGVNFFLGGHDQQRALEVVFLLAFAGFMLASPGRLGRALPRGRVASGSLACFFILGAIASISALSARFAFYEVASLFLLLLVGLAVADEIAATGTDGLVRVLQAMAGICLLYGFKVVVVYVSVFAVGLQPDALAFTPGFNNYRFFNHTQTVTLPLLVALIVLAPRGTMIRWAWTLLTALWWALIAVTSARGTLLGLVVGCIVALALRRRHAGAFLKTMALTAVGGAVIYVVFFFLIPEAAGFHPFGVLARTVERTVANPDSGRMALWIRAVDMIAQHPLLGVGPLHFAHSVVDPTMASHPHDWALQIGAEWGLPALLCLCLAIGSGTRALARSGARIPDSDVRNRAILAALLVTGAAILVDGMVSGSLVMPQSQLAIALYLGCAVGWNRALGVGSDAVPAQLPMAWRVGAAAVVAAAMLALAAGVWPEIVDRANGEPLTAQQEAANHGYAYWPRLWRAGRF
jgi:O-antigen ligase